MTAPVHCVWDGEAFAPLPRFAKLCDREFVIGQPYPLVVQEERSQAAHNHYFAAIQEGWKNLREDVAERFPTAEHLRKYALCKAGFADERSIVCASKAEAQRIAAFVRPMDEYAVIVVRDATIRVFTAKSQSMRAMGKADFSASKEAVLDIVSGMIGVKAGDLKAHSEAA